VAALAVVRGSPIGKSRRLRYHTLVVTIGSTQRTAWWIHIVHSSPLEPRSL